MFLLHFHVVRLGSEVVDRLTCGSRSDGNIDLIVFPKTRETVGELSAPVTAEFLGNLNVVSDFRTRVNFSLQKI